VLRRAGVSPDAWVRVTPTAGGGGGVLSMDGKNRGDLPLDGGRQLSAAGPISGGGGGGFVSVAVPARTLVAGALDITSVRPTPCTLYPVPCTLYPVPCTLYPKP